MKGTCTRRTKLQKALEGEGITRSSTEKERADDARETRAATRSDTPSKNDAASKRLEELDIQAGAGMMYGVSGKVVKNTKANRDRRAQVDGARLATLVDGIEAQLSGGPGEEPKEAAKPAAKKPPAKPPAAKPPAKPTAPPAAPARPATPPRSSWKVARRKEADAPHE